MKMCVIAANRQVSHSQLMLLYCVCDVRDVCHSVLISVHMLAGDRCY